MSNEMTIEEKISITEHMVKILEMQVEDATANYEFYSKRLENKIKVLEDARAILVGYKIRKSKGETK